MSQHCSLSPNPSMNFARTSWRSWRCTALCCLFLVNVVFFCYGCLCFVGLCWSLYCSSCFIALSAKCIPFEVAQRHARKPTGACPWPLNRKTKWSAFSGTFKVWRKPDSPPTNCSLSICLSVCLSLYLSIYLFLLQTEQHGATYLYTKSGAAKLCSFTAVFLLCSTPVQICAQEQLQSGKVLRLWSTRVSGGRVLVSNNFQSNTRKQIRAEHVS